MGQLLDVEERAQGAAARAVEDPGSTEPENLREGSAKELAGAPAAEKPRGQGCGRDRACLCTTCLRHFHHLCVFEAYSPESLWGPGLSSKTLCLS